jgi:hypothetical protein
MKTCIHCKVEQLQENFPSELKNGKRRYKGTCKKCLNARVREKYYNDNNVREKHLKRVALNNKQYKKISQEKMVELLSNKSCIDCGFSDIRALDFDHLSGKIHNVSRLLGRTSWEKVEKEINKCEVRCKNCHAIKTCEDQNWYKSVKNLSQSLDKSNNQ